MESLQLSTPGAGALPSMAVLVGGWIVLFLIALLARIRPSRSGILMGAVLSAFVGGMCCAELRRHGLLELPPGAVVIPVLGLALHDVVRFALLGAGGALASEALLGWQGKRDPESPPTKLNS